MWHRRRSWFQRPRWWVDYLLTALTTTVVFWMLGRLVTPMLSVGEVALLAALLSVGPTWHGQRAHRAWEQLEMSSVASPADLHAAEGVVRHSRHTTSPAVLIEALRIAELARRELSSPVGGLIIATVLAGVFVVLAVVTASLWVLPLAGAGLLAAALGTVRAHQLDRRLQELRAQVAAEEARSSERG